MFCCPLPSFSNFTARANNAEPNNAPGIAIFVEDHSNAVWLNRLMTVSALFLLVFGLSQFGYHHSLQEAVICTTVGGLSLVFSIWRSHRLDHDRRIFNQKIGLQSNTIWQMLENCMRSL